MNRPSLIVIGKERRIPLKSGKTVIGRAPNVTIRLTDDRKVSGRHTEIVRKKTGYMVRDLKSTNGTIVNGKRVTEPQLLHHNDRLQIGKTAFAFDLGDVDLDGQMSTTIPSERVQQRLNETRGAQPLSAGESPSRPPTPLDPPTERYHFEPTNFLSRRTARLFANRTTYPNKDAAQAALAQAKDALPPIESAYQPIDKQSSNFIQRLLDWVSPIRSETKFCEATGRPLRSAASAIYPFDAAEDLAQILHAWNSELLEYVPVATNEERKQRHCTRLVLWWHKEAETAYLEQMVYFVGDISDSQGKRGKALRDQWLVASKPMDNSIAQRYMDVLG